MRKIYLIEHWSNGYWSESRGKFGGILFAEKYESEKEVEEAIKDILGSGEKGPVFMLTGWE